MSERKPPLCMSDHGQLEELKYVDENHVDPVLTSKVDVALRLAVELARSFGNVLNALADTNTPKADDVGIHLAGEQRLTKNSDLREASLYGRVLLSEAVKATSGLPFEYKVVTCKGCGRYWLGSDVATWRDLETRADLEADKAVTCCPACENRIGVKISEVL